jgi:hypothetical protein
MIAIGSVVRIGEGASSAPRIPPSNTTIGIPDIARAWAALRTNTFRIRVLLGNREPSIT